jgi:3-oxoacyl-[acyl-carrier protein] reductase
VGGIASPPGLAVITGGHGDLAKALSEQLRQNDWEVLAPGRAELDVSDTSSVKTWFSRLPRLDLLINNAGTRQDGLMANLEEAAWDAVLKTNLRGAFLCSREAARRFMSQKSGHIINIGSYSALSGPVGQVNYAAAKAGLIGLTRSLAREFGPAGVRVNCVLPGWLETKFTTSVPEKHREAARQEHVLGRFNTVEDAARFIVFLHSMEHISGQVFQLDSRVHQGF